MKASKRKQKEADDFEFFYFSLVEVALNKIASDKSGYNSSSRGWDKVVDLQDAPSAEYLELDDASASISKRWRFL